MCRIGELLLPRALAPGSGSAEFARCVEFTVCGGVCIMAGVVCVSFLLGWVLTNPKYMTGHTAIVGYTRGWIFGENGSVVWQKKDDFALDTVVMRWGHATDTENCAGLACGISWTLHSTFCSRMLPRFPERNGVVSFVDCNTLRSAVVRALRTWEMNSQHIKFVDVTDECAHTFDDADDCPLAELQIFASDMKMFGDQPSEFAAMVVHNYTKLDKTPTTTAGVQLQNGYGLLASRLYVNDNGCWYLDATFCYAFNRLLEYTDAYIADFLVKLCAFGLMAVAISVMLRGCLQLTFATFGCVGYMTKTDRRRQEVSNVGTTSALPRRAIASLGSKLGEFHVAAILMTMVGITFGPVFYIQFFIPCWNCYDFEATIAHEAGHVLGFGHPNAQPAYNLQVPTETAMSETTCRAPLDYVELHPPSEAQTNLETSVMHSVTKHRDRTCLLQDDLDGLNFLYPSCLNARKAPLCIKQTQFLGYIRLAIAAAVPFAASVAFVMLLQGLAKGHQKFELKLMREARRKGKVNQRWLRASLRASTRANRRSSCDADGGAHLPGAHARSSGWAAPVKQIRTQHGRVMAATSKNLVQLLQAYGKSTAGRAGESRPNNENGATTRPDAPIKAQRKPRVNPRPLGPQALDATCGSAASLQARPQQESHIRPRRISSVGTAVKRAARDEDYESPLHA